MLDGEDDEGVGGEEEGGVMVDMKVVKEVDVNEDEGLGKETLKDINTR